MFKLLRSPHSPSLSRSFFTHHLLRAGHNKWSKIKDKKGANDLEKSSNYNKLSREIANAFKIGGSIDPQKNAMLAAALKKAKQAGLPKQNIEKALASCVSGKEHTGERVVYEALAFKSVGVIIECVTDNLNRTIHHVREILTSYSAHMTPVNFMFERGGCVTVELTDKTGTFSAFQDLVLVNDATDIKMDISSSDQHKATFRVYCEPSQLAEMQSVIENEKDDLEATATIQSAELIYSPVDGETVDPELKEQVEKLVQGLKGIDDVVKVWTSLD